MRKSILITVAIICVAIINANAQVQGPNNPSSAVASGSGASFPSLSGLYANDNNPAYSDLAAFPTCIGAILCYYSQQVVVSGFGFTIPANATITGVKVEISKKVSQPVTTIHDSVIQLVIGGVASGLNLSAVNQWQMNFTYETYGDSTNLWGNSLSPADVNNPSFGIKLQLSNGNIDQTAQIDHVRMTVYYNTASVVSINSAIQDITVYHQNESLIIKSEPDNQLEQLSIYDNTGVEVYRDNSGHLQVPVGFITPGSYILRLTFANGVLVRKMFLK